MRGCAMSMQADGAVAPTGILTFLFTDIEGSTRRWEADPESMRAALASHDVVLKDAIESHAGWLFKHTGDGMCAAFTSTRAAVEAAIAAQRALELPVRMGIATGEAEHRRGDYFGVVLNHAARVMSAGHGGQILIDGVTAGLMSGIDLEALGERRLRDIAAPVAIYQVRAPGLPTAFPRLKTVDPTPGNLRRPDTSFIGREPEVASLETALNNHRLVTLIGVGGVGKTRLALETAARMTEHFADGVWVVELAAISDPTAVPDAAAAALGITQQPGMTVTESVATTLGRGSRLLVFDNCEHLVEAAADMIEAILAESDALRILATSREGLRLGDEQLWPVSTLDVDSSAATLFVDRAAAVASTPLVDHPDTVAEVCRRLDGLPLAIELAASRLQSMTVTELRDRLEDRFRLLVGARRGLEHHQTLRHAVQWSYDLLNETEQTVLQRCSVFAGGFDLAAARVVAGAANDLDILDLLDALVRKSLLLADRTSTRTRFSMLETIRQFAEEQLIVAGDADHARTAHAVYFAERENDVLALWDSPNQREAYAWVTTELANLRAAFRWAAAHDDLDTAAPIAVYATIIGFWVERHEPMAWAEELIAPAKAGEHRRLAQLYVVAALCYLTGRVECAVGYLDAGHAAVDSGRFDALSSKFEGILAGAYLASGDLPRCLEVYRNRIDQTPGTHVVATASLVLGLEIAGDHDEALTVAKDLISIADASDNPHAMSWARFAHGFACRDVDPEAAYRSFTRGLKVAQDSDNRRVASILAVGLSDLAAFHGDPTDAFTFLTAAIRSLYNSDSVSILPIALATLAAVFDRLGRYETAATLSGFAVSPVTRVGLPEIDTTITHLRAVLGDGIYDARAHAGSIMTNAEMTSYALEQIDLARAREGD